MSWLFSRGLVEECLEQQNLAYPLSVQLSWIGTADAFLSSDRIQDSLDPVSQYGMTFVPLTADRGAGSLILSLEGFLAKRSQQRPEDAMWRSIYGPKCTEWSRR